MNKINLILCKITYSLLVCLLIAVLAYLMRDSTKYLHYETINTMVTRIKIAASIPHQRSKIYWRNM